MKARCSNDHLQTCEPNWRSEICSGRLSKAKTPRGLLDVCHHISLQKAIIRGRLNSYLNLLSYRHDLQQPTLSKRPTMVFGCDRPDGSEIKHDKSTRFNYPFRGHVLTERQPRTNLVESSCFSPLQAVVLRFLFLPFISIAFHPSRGSIPLHRQSQSVLLLSVSHILALLIKRHGSLILYLTEL
jgi:hypothetical protein